MLLLEAGIEKIRDGRTDDDDGTDDGTNDWMDGRTEDDDVDDDGHMSKIHLNYVTIYRKIH